MIRIKRIDAIRSASMQYLPLVVQIKTDRSENTRYIYPTYSCLFAELLARAICLAVYSSNEIRPACCACF